jgi:hypothetical protein
MTTITRPASADPSATSTISSLGQLAYRDDLEIARRRMNHLALWHAKPMPMTQEGGSAPPAGPVEKSANRKLSSFRSRQPSAFQRYLALRHSALD